MAEQQLTTDALWQQLQAQAAAQSDSEPMLSTYFHSSILNHGDFVSALSFHVAAMLDSPTVSGLMLNDVFTLLLADNPAMIDAAVADIAAYYDRDPACDNFVRPFLFYKGCIATQAHRFGHVLWNQGRRSLALYLQNRVSVLWGVDIHPAAQLGRALMIDHATGLVIGETATVGDNVSVLQGVTFGGTGCESGKRHPDIGSGVMVGAGARILGNIQVGEGVKVGAGSVVLESVPAHVTVAGVPATIVGKPREALPALSMDQHLES